MFVGLGTLVNVATVLVGGTLGVLIGHRLPQRTRNVVTDGLGLVTLLIAGTSLVAITDAGWIDAVGSTAPLLIVLGAVLVGGITGSLLRLEDRLEGVGGWLQRRLAAGEGSEGRVRFIDGYVTASIIFCTGPLTILGSLTEGLGDGPQQLLLKSVLDGFAAIAFAASFGWGVVAAALTVLVLQGGLTAIGAVLGSFLPDAELAALTVTGGVLLVGMALRLLDVKQIKVADLLPALVFAPALTTLVAALR